MDKSKIRTIFDSVYQKHVDALFRFVYFRVSDREEAIDIVEESYVRLWREMLKGQVLEPRAFLYKVARNLVIDWYRKEKPIAIPTFSDDTEEGEISLDMFAANLPTSEIVSDSRLVIEKISSLPKIYQEAVYLRFVEELSPREIAEIVGESSNTVSVRINRGISELRKIFKLT